MDKYYQEALRKIEEAQKRGATKLNLFGMKLTVLPPEIGNLSRLTELSLSGNMLTTLPPEIGNLSRLTYLALGRNMLTTLPPEIGNLSRLTWLNLSENQLAELPPEIGNLSDLISLSLRHNYLTALPPEITQLTNVSRWDFTEGNHLASLPPEIREQGVEAILKYLREQLHARRRQWASKLILVGEGGVGKTSVLKQLLDEGFDPEEDTTHGIQIRELKLAHPTEDATMLLKAWDFGGQEIYHATHQFFLTNRSLFLLVWNTRYGYEQGKLHYWLDTIKALAPDSPVLLVATHTDERAADFPLAEFQEEFPQIVGQAAVSNKTGAGINELRQAVRETAAGLPLMGEMWPETWLNAANATRRRRKRYITARELWKTMKKYGVAEDSYKILAMWLHELGDILFFQDDEELYDTVIVKPQWVAEHIDRVLISQDDQLVKYGIFTRTHMSEVWGDIPLVMRERFLRLMEKFDLSYRIPDDPENKSLVVERLSKDEADYRGEWAAIQQDGCNQLNMRYVLDLSTPAGIPTWFIARAHRFTLHTHWRSGALFGDDRRDYSHLGLVRAFPHQRYIEITVRGPHPYNFFTLLRDGFEVTLRRFPGLGFKRMIPCPGHNGVPCSHEFDHEHLLYAESEKVYEIQCPKTLKSASVLQMLFGVDYQVTENVVAQVEDKQTTALDSGLAQVEDKRIVALDSDLTLQLERGFSLLYTRFDTRFDRMEKLLESGVLELAALMQRGFATLFTIEQSREESESPYVFTLSPQEGDSWKDKLKDILGQEIELQLFCHHPGEWHPVGEPYIIADPNKWLRSIGGHMGRLVKVLKFAVPLALPGVVELTPEYVKLFESKLKLMEELVKKLPDIRESRGARFEGMGDTDEIYDARGPLLRDVRKLLLELDPEREFRGLRKVLTPEGHYLWLCEYHAQEYR